MTSDLHQRAKQAFSSLIDLDTDQRNERLDELDNESPELAREVRSLLAYHTDDSLVVPPVGPRIRTRSTLSTTYQTRSFSWLVAPMRLLSAAFPFFAAAVALSIWAHRLVDDSVRDSVSIHLAETVDLHLSELQQWERQQIAEALDWSRDSELIQVIQALLAEIQAYSADTPELKNALEQTRYSQRMEEILLRLKGQPVQYAVWDRRMLTIANWNQSNRPEILGQFVTPGGAALLAPVLRGQARLVFPNQITTITDGFPSKTDSPVVSIFVPILDPDTAAVIAALMVRGYGLEEQFTTLLEAWREEPEQETYLIDGRGAILTETRYGAALESLELALDETRHRRAPLAWDPGVNLLNREKPEYGPSAWPPTLLARQIAAGNDGMNADGYRNYVGQVVVGAWRWLPDHELGIAFEQEQTRAFEVVHLVRNALVAANGLFAICIIGVAFLASVSTLNRQRLRDVGEVGPYQVQELLGEGGMGRVYLAEHALLCRQSAVKVLTKGLNDLSVISRFEREVQLASQLTHPNTISIYDFGRNNDGLFYYAMEYINGAHLGQLIEYNGPLEPGRCIFILRQLCRALLEAHQAGVVHRDIKPQNIMVCNRGGEPDFVKLFDYGLVKAFAPGVSHSSSQTRIVVGTPRFMAPERLSSPWLADPRVDVYSVGAVAYFLLTGQLPPLVTVDHSLDQEPIGVETLDLPPAVVDFGGLLSVCMAVEPSMRPSNMSSLTREFDELSEKYPWDREDSVEWWNHHESKLFHLVQEKRKKLAAEHYDNLA